ncbi:MAG: class I SAM-dependent RNA methyltransferase [Lachnospiraceae bacterium]|nr:class I SAM-dependent RNA methyltransferase [Lachnospiraceae bacterium]
MRKGLECEGETVSIGFPNKGKVKIKAAFVNDERVDADGDEGYVLVKNALPGQTVRFRISKTRNGRAEGNLVSVVKKAPCEISDICPQAGLCGGCIYQGFPYEETLKIKEAQVKDLLKDYVEGAQYDGVKPSPVETGYRNKMEYTFGDEYKDGPLTIGLHKRGSFYDLADASCCRIADEDFGKILEYTKNFFAEKKLPFYHRMYHTGLLRHLLVRKAAKTGEILTALVTSSECKDGHEDDRPLLSDARYEADSLAAVYDDWKEGLCALELSGSITGIIHVVNDSAADAVKADSVEVLYGRDYFEEELLGLKFRITPFSFFQTNSLGAEVLYSLARTYLSGSENGAHVFDLYSGTGTIAQILAPAARKVTGVEIVAEAVEAAKENAKLNGLTNCEFIAGDVLKVLDELTDEKPDCIVLDPPRDGVNPKALLKILRYGVDKLVYISCKPTSLQRDLEMITACGYEVKRWGMVDMFPFTGNIETVVLLSKLSEAKHHIEVKVDMDELDLTSAEAKATYKEIQDWVQEKYGFHVTNLNIAQVKQKHGIIERENYNKPKSENSNQPGCPEEKIKAIEDAMQHFQMI